MKPVAKGNVVLPKSVTPARIYANINGAIAAFKALTKEDIEKLDAVAASGKQKRYVSSRWEYLRIDPNFVFPLF